MTLTDVDLEIRDADPSDPLRMDPSKIAEQTATGTARIQADGKVVVTMPDQGDPGEG